MKLSASSLDLLDGEISEFIITGKYSGSGDISITSINPSIGFDDVDESSTLVHEELTQAHIDATTREYPLDFVKQFNHLNEKLATL